MKYVSSDSEGFIGTVAEIVKKAKAVAESLEDGSRKLNAMIERANISGPGDHREKRLQDDLIIPTIACVTNAINDVQEELIKYKMAVAAMSGEGYLDEDNLIKQIEIIKSMKANIASTMRTYQLLAMQDDAVLNEAMFLGLKCRMVEISNSLQEDMDGLQRKLDKLNRFHFQTYRLLKVSLNHLRTAMQGVRTLKKTVIYSDGTYGLPEGKRKQKSYLQRITFGRSRLERYGVTHDKIK